MICDLAETYHILDYKQLQNSLVAVLVFGLKENSRVKLAMSDQVISTETVLLSGIFDRLNLLLWSKTKDGSKGRNQPKMLLDRFVCKETCSFDSREEFELERIRILAGRR